MAELRGVMRTNAYGTFFDDKLLQYIEQKNNDEAWKILKDVDSCHLRSSFGTTLLHFAAKYGNKDFAQHLINLGVIVDAQNRLQKTPLMFAIDSNQISTIRVLHDANANIFLQNSRGNCALSKILNPYQRNTWSIEEAILQKVSVESLNSSAFVQNKKFNQNCPLYYFIILKNAEITRCLLQNGSLVDAKCLVTEETALHKAVQHNDLENVKVLMEYNADINAKRYDGKTPIACIGCFPDQAKTLEIVKILINAGATLIDHECNNIILVQKILLCGNREMIRTVLECSIDLHFADYRGMTSLHYLALNRNEGILEELKGFQFDINVRSQKTLQTMLHFATMIGNTSSMQFLLNHGADIDARDARNLTPLITAVHNFNQLRPVEFLLERGADIQVFTEDNIVPLAMGPIMDTYFATFKLILAHLAILNSSGHVIQQSMQRAIESNLELESEFESYKLQVEELKPLIVHKTITLYDFLTVSDETISLYAKNKIHIPNILDLIMECSNLDLYYSRRLQKRYLKFTRLTKLRKTVEIILYNILQEAWNISIYNVIEKIVSYLPDQDLYSFYKLSYTYG